MKMKISSLTLTLLISGCTTLQSTPSSNPGKFWENPIVGESVIYFYCGDEKFFYESFMTKFTGVGRGAKPENNFVSPLSRCAFKVDGKKYTSLNANEVGKIIVKPGIYTIEPIGGYMDFNSEFKFMSTVKANPSTKHAASISSVVVETYKKRDLTVTARDLDEKMLSILKETRSPVELKEYK